MATPGGKRRREILAYRASATSICYEHSLLHSPRVIAIDETLNATIAVVGAYRMGIVNRLALRENAMMERRTERDSR